MMKNKMIEELHSARYNFKGWPIELQEKLIKQILDEYAYNCGVNNINVDYYELTAKNFSKDMYMNYLQGLEHYKNGI